MAKLKENQPHRPAIRGGFTLLELVLVLVILSILATVALQMVEPQVDQARFEATQAVVRDVETAIYADRPRGDGRALISGFYADMGRLPRAFPEEIDGVNVLTSRELWDGRLAVLATGATEPAFAYAMLPASASNLSSTTDSNSETVTPDSTVFLGVGWRGPYLKLNVGADRLRDGWGQDLVSFTAYANSATYPHLRGPGDTDVLAAGASLLGVRSLGGGDLEGVPGPSAAYDRDIPAIVVGGSGLGLNHAQLTGFVTGRVYVAHTHRTMPDTPVDPADLIVQIYVPNGSAAGKIRVERAELTLRAPPPDQNYKFDVFDFRFDNDHDEDPNTHPIPVTFPVGSRVMRAYFNPLTGDSSGDYGDGMDDPPSSPPLTFDLYGTGNVLELTVN